MKNMMIEYAVNLKIGSTPDLVLMSTITSDLNTAKEHLERTKKIILYRRNIGKSRSLSSGPLL